MKVSSLTPESALQAQAGALEAASLPATFSGVVASVKAALNRMGTAIALGEAGDLDAADAWRRQNGTN